MASEVSIVISAKDQASKVIGGIGGSLTKVGKLAATGIAVGIGAAATAVGALGAAAAKLAIDAAPIKGVQDAFNGLADAAGVGGEAMLRALQKGSAGMVTNTDLMKSFNKAAQLVSQDFATKLPDAMGYLGKVAAATGQDMGFLLDSLVTGVGRVSPMILDNLGIQVDLTAATEEYAASIGKTAAELTKTEQQTAVMNQVLAKLAENTAAMPDVVGSAQQQWAALGVQFQNLKDEIGVALLPVFQKVLGWLSEVASDAIPIVVDWVKNKFIPALSDLWAFIQKNVIPVLKDVYAWLKDNIPPAIQKVTDYWNTVLKPALDGIWDFIKTNVIPIFQDLKARLDQDMPGAIQELVRWWNNTLKPALEALWKFLSEDMKPIWDALAELIGVTIALAFEALKAAWELVLKPALQAIWDIIQEKVLPAIKALSENETLEKWIDNIAGFIDNLVKKLQNAVTWFHNLGKAKEGTDTSVPSTGYTGPAYGGVKQEQFGGPVFGGQPYIVGERGPELFVPRTAGSIVNNWSLTINEAGSRGNVVMDFEIMKALARA